MGEAIFNSYFFHLCFHEKVNRGVHVVLASLFGRPIIRSISYFFGQPKIVSETGQFFFVHSLEFLGASMWFWSVSLADQLSGQLLIFYGQSKNSEIGQKNFVHSLDLFFQSFLKIGHSLISRQDKKNQESGQNKIVQSLRDNFFWPTKKSEKLTGQFVGQETDQNHMDVPFLSSLFCKLVTL